METKKEKNVEKVMEKLRNEMRQMSTNLNQAKDHSIRKSVSIMETQLERNNEAFESHLKEVNIKHKKDMGTRIRQYEMTVNELKCQLQAKENAMDQLKGRLEECRTAKNEALEELSKTRKYYGDRCKELEACISEGRESLVLLKSERDRRKSEVSKVQELEIIVGKCRSEIESLENRLEVIQNEVKEKERLIEQLEEAKARLVESVASVQKENDHLNGKLEKYMELCKTKVESNDSVQKVLEEQLTKVQTDLDDTKKSLILEQVRSDKLTDEMETLRKENGLLKVDLRIESRQKREAEAKLKSKESTNAAVVEKVSECEKSNAVLSSKLSAIHNEINSLKDQLEAKNKENAALLAIQQELKEQKAQFLQENSALRNEIAAFKIKANECENLEAVIAKKMEVINQKVELIEEKDRKIKALQNNVDVLKEASSVLDTQLREFESILEQKLSELQASERYKDILENENREIREQLKNCRIELNEAKSLKAFTEKRLEITESTLKTQNETKDTEYHLILEKLNVAAARNEELSTEVTALTTQLSSVEDEKFLLRKRIETVSSEKDRLDKEIYSLVKTVVDAKEENSSLKEALKETLGKAESYKQKFVASNEDYADLEQAKQTSDLMLTTRIEQQDKLIDYLREQLAAYQDKKKKSIIFTPKRNEKESSYGIRQGSSLSTPRNWGLQSQTPTSKKATPLCLEKEKIEVRNLEEIRENLRYQLESLQKTSTPIPNARTSQLR